MFFVVFFCNLGESTLVEHPFVFNSSLKVKYVDKYIKSVQLKRNPPWMA